MSQPDQEIQDPAQGAAGTQSIHFSVTITKPGQPGGVRRHHTISASSRLGRLGAREDISEEQDWNDDEFVGEDPVQGYGAVGEKGGLHRQASLPTTYHRRMLSLFKCTCLSIQI